MTKAYKLGNLLFVEVAPFSYSFRELSELLKNLVEPHFAAGLVDYPLFNREGERPFHKGQYGKGLIPDGDIRDQQLRKELGLVEQTEPYRLSHGDALIFIDVYIHTNPIGLLHLEKESTVSHPHHGEGILPSGHYEIRTSLSGTWYGKPVDGCHILKWDEKGAFKLYARSWDKDFVYIVKLKKTGGAYLLNFYYWHSYLVFENGEFEGKHVTRTEVTFFPDRSERPGEARKDMHIYGDWGKWKEVLSQTIDDRSYTDNFGYILYMLTMAIEGKLDTVGWREGLENTDIKEVWDLLVESQGIDQLYKDLNLKVLEETPFGILTAYSKSINMLWMKNTKTGQLDFCRAVNAIENPTVAAAILELFSLIKQEEFEKTQLLPCDQ